MEEEIKPNDLILLKFAKLTLFLDKEFLETKHPIAWDLGFQSNVILIE